MTTFESDLSGYAIIDDDNIADVVAESDANEFGRGLEPTKQDAFGSIGCTTPFSIPVIPRSEWRERIEEKEQKGRV